MIYLVVGLLGGVICAAIAPSKNRSAIGWFVIGFLIPLIGIILIVVLGPANDGLQPPMAQGFEIEAPATRATPKEDPTQTLAKLASLRDQGVITPDEFEQKKREVLARV